MCVLCVRRARIGTSDDGRARWAELEALGCVAQVNAPSTSDARDSDLNHRARHSHGALCRWQVSEVIGRDGAIGKVAIALLGEDARLFNDQYVVKPAHEEGARFGWHRDGQYEKWTPDDTKEDDDDEEEGRLKKKKTSLNFPSYLPSFRI